MKILFIYPAFERHAQSHPELLEYVPGEEYIGSPSLGIASVAACTPPEFEVAYLDDRVTPVGEPLPEADLYALSFFTPAASRALAIADMLRQTGKPVVAGGIFPTLMPELCAAHFDAVVVGEGEAVWPQLCRDAAAGRLAPRYQARQPVDPASLPLPRMELYFGAETPDFSPHDYPVQISRGCPFRCDACVVPLTMGRKLRPLPLEHNLQLLEQLARAGKRCSLTEDTSLMFVSGARRRLRELLRRLGRQEMDPAVRISYLGTSIPLLLHAEEEVFSEARAAGMNRFYIVGGFDKVTRDAFSRGQPQALEQVRQAVSRCQQAGIEPYMSFLVGGEDDQEGIFERILEFADSVRLTIAEFAIATPYPGTPLWETLQRQGRIFDRDWRHYNDANVVFTPRVMSPEQLLDGYLMLWREFYRSRQHLAEADQESRTIQF